MKFVGCLLIAILATIPFGYGKSIVHKNESPAGIQEVDIVISNLENSQNLKKKEGPGYSWLPASIQRFFKLPSTSESATTQAEESKTRTKRSVRPGRRSKKRSRKRSSKPKKPRRGPRKPRRRSRDRPRPRRPPMGSRSRRPQWGSRPNRRRPPNFNLDRFKAPYRPDRFQESNRLGRFQPPNPQGRFRSNMSRRRPSQQFQQSGQSSMWGEGQLRDSPGIQQFMKGFPQI